MKTHVNHCCRLCVIPEPQQWVVVHTGFVLGAGSELAAAWHDTDADKSVPCTRIHLLIIHAVNTSYSRPQADLFCYHHTDQSHTVLLAAICPLCASCFYTYFTDVCLSHSSVVSKRQTESPKTLVFADARFIPKFERDHREQERCDEAIHFIETSTVGLSTLRQRDVFPP